MDMTKRWTRIMPVCTVCNDEAAVKVNEAWFCVEHSHLGLVAQTRHRAEAVGIDPDHAEAELMGMLTRLASPPPLYARILGMMPDDARWSWNQPCCEACWVSLEGEHDEYNNLRALRVPVIVMPEKDGAFLDACAWCGQPTFIGIYRREDPHKVPYPAWEQADDE